MPTRPTVADADHHLLLLRGGEILALDPRRPTRIPAAGEASIEWDGSRPVLIGEGARVNDRRIRRRRLRPGDRVRVGSFAAVYARLAAPRAAAS